jgi:hypothetical protein
MKAVAVDFGPSRNRHTGIRTIDTFEDGSFIIVHKSGFREVFTGAKKIFVVSAKKCVLGIDSETVNP